MLHSTVQYSKLRGAVNDATMMKRLYERFVSSTPFADPTISKAKFLRQSKSFVASGTKGWKRDADEGVCASVETFKSNTGQYLLYLECYNTTIDNRSTRSILALLLCDTTLLLLLLVFSEARKRL